MKDIPRFGTNGRAWAGPGYWVVFSIVVAVFTGCGSRQSAELIHFDVPAGPAVETLKEAARQAEVEFIFSSDLVQDLRTPAVRGDYRLMEAFERMLEDSPFLVVRHEGSGVYSIQRAVKP